MIPKRAIELAIKGGWVAEWIEVGTPHNGNKKISVSMFPFKSLHTADIEEVYRIAKKGANLHKIALDHSFWRALGKALEWQTTKTATFGAEMGTFWFFENEWQAKAHEFYDLILTGGDTQKFWDELLLTNSKEK